MKFKILKETEYDEDDYKLNTYYWTIPSNPIRRLIGWIYYFLLFGDSKIITLHSSKAEAILYIKNFNKGTKRQFV